MNLYASAVFQDDTVFGSARHRPRDAAAAASSTHQLLGALRRPKAVDGGLRIVNALFVLALNVGVRPPDALQSDDVATLEAWLRPDDARVRSADEAAELVGAALQAQFEFNVGRSAERLRYRVAVDPTSDKLLRAIGAARLKAKRTHATLFWFNGHGTPCASDNGELWIFNDDFSHYVPLSIYSLQEALQTPAVYVFDCSRAARLVSHFVAFCDERERDELARAAAAAGDAPPPPQPALSAQLRSRCVLLAACAAHQTLPTNPALPADLFTACLTAPLKTTLFLASQVACARTLTSAQFAARHIDPALCDVPGALSDKATPLGFLDWLQTSVCDAIAYESVLPLERFQMLFREDVTLAGLCRNFLVAQRLMARYGVTPVAYPALPDVSRHPLWSAFDAALEQVVLQLDSSTAAAAAATTFEPPPFFDEQLCAAELALAGAGAAAAAAQRRVPLTTLPIVLQALLGASHRARALNWLARFVAADAETATAHCLAIDALPYIAGLLRTRRPNLRRALLVVWVHLLRVDRTIAADLLAAPHGVAFLLDALASQAAAEASAAAFALLVVVVHTDCAGQQWDKLLVDAATLMRSDAAATTTAAALRLWSALLVGAVAQRTTRTAVPPLAQRSLLSLLHGDASADVRAAAACALGSVLGSRSAVSRDDAASIVVAIAALATDASATVRAEVLGALVRYVVVVVSARDDAAVDSDEDDSKRGIASSVRACLDGVFELLERDAFVQIAWGAALARKSLNSSSSSSSSSSSNGSSSNAAELLAAAPSTFADFACSNACSDEWIGGVAAPLLSQLAGDNDVAATEAATPVVQQRDEAVESSWSAVHPLSARVLDARSPEHVGRLHSATPEQLFRIRRQTELEASVAEWQRREASGERYVLESQLKAMRRSLKHSSSSSSSTTTMTTTSVDEPDDNDEAPSAAAPLSVPPTTALLRHPPVRLEHDVALLPLGKGVVPRALLCDSIRGDCVFAASDGTAGVWQIASGDGDSAAASAPLSRFRMTRADGGRVAPSAAALLNRRSAQPLLLVASLNDACVRVWRDYRATDAAHLVAAWTLDLGAAPPLRPSSPSPTPSLSLSSSSLADSAGSEVGSAVAAAAALVVAWRQRSARLAVACRQRVLLFDAAAERELWHADAVPANATALHADYMAQRLVVGDSDGACTLLDTRLRPDDAVVGRLRPSDAGAVLELGVPTLRPASLVAVHASAAARVWDVRVAASLAAPLVFGDARGAASCAAVHKRLPLLAVGSQQLRRLWLYSSDGFLLQELRHQRFGGARLGAATLLQFDHFRPHVALGSADGISYHVAEPLFASKGES